MGWHAGIEPIGYWNLLATPSLRPWAWISGGRWGISEDNYDLFWAGLHVGVDLLL